MNAAEIIGDFRDQFPEYDAVSDSIVTKYLNLAISIHAICPNATIYLAAHFYTVDQSTGVGSTGGSVDSGGSSRERTSDSAGKLSASYSSISKSEADAQYAGTPYGRTYILLRDACPGKRFSVRVV